MPLWRAQHFLAVLRTPKVDTLTLRSTGTDAARLSVHLLCSKSGAKRPRPNACASLSLLTNTCFLLNRPDEDL